MPCYSPLTGYRSKSSNPNTGKRSIVFNPQHGYADMQVQVPCGQCIGCRLEKSRQWAMRCVHEASLHDHNSFITLTYSPENLPKDRSLNKSHFQKFIKRLRKKIYPIKIKYFHCGEYGEENWRPHYHAIIFNYDFPDKQPFKIVNGATLYRSEELEELWKYGYSSIGTVTFESAAYVARYALKKVTGENAEEHYQVFDEDGEIHKIIPEYTTMSRRPPIAKEWFDKFKDDVYPKDFVTMRGQKLKPPKFYDKELEKIHEKEYLKIKGKRIKNAKENKSDNTIDRLLTKETVKKSQIKTLKRTL